MKDKSKRIYEVEIKSMALVREGKKSLITYFQGGPKKLIVSNLKYLFPQYTNPQDKPSIYITPITFREFEARKNGEQIKQKAHFVQGEGDLNI